MEFIRTYTAVLKGLTPLILHKDDVDWADRMEEWKADPDNKKNSKAGDDRTPAWRWIGCLYHDGEHLGISGDNISKCLMEGGAMVPTGKGQKTFKAQTQSGMKVNDLYTPLLVNGKEIPFEPVKALMDVKAFPDHIQAVQKMGFRLMAKRAKVASNKHIRVRPVFDEWALGISLSVWDDQLTSGVLETILKFSGTYKGLGDWRPSSPKSPGSYGMFEVVELNEV